MTPDREGRVSLRFQTLLQSDFSLPHGGCPQGERRYGGRTGGLRVACRSAGTACRHRAQRSRQSRQRNWLCGAADTTPTHIHIHTYTHARDRRFKSYLAAAPHGRPAATRFVTEEYGSGRDKYCMRLISSIFYYNIRGARGVAELENSLAISD